MTNPKPLNNRLWNLLVEVVEKRRPALLPLTLKAQLVEELCDAVMDEFCDTGLQNNDEPDERGLELEALIDELRRFQREAEDRGTAR